MVMEIYQSENIRPLNLQVSGWNIPNEACDPLLFVSVPASGAQAHRVMFIYVFLELGTKCINCCVCCNLTIPAAVVLVTVCVNCPCILRNWYLLIQGQNPGVECRIVVCCLYFKIWKSVSGGFGVVLLFVGFVRVTCVLWVFRVRWVEDKG